jgi:hypothetical protein
MCTQHFKTISVGNISLFYLCWLSDIRWKHCQRFDSCLSSNRIPRKTPRTRKSQSGRSSPFCNYKVAKQLFLNLLSAASDFVCFLLPGGESRLCCHLTVWLPGTITVSSPLSLPPMPTPSLKGSKWTTEGKDNNIADDSCLSTSPESPLP